ncbi:MAG: glycosyltransferase [Deltaproteobacteria bacterium]|nr:glycosyltransferase [Deltaproteobacteria bacterium]
MQQTDRRSVLFVSSTLSAGGAERFVSNVLGHLDRERFAPSLALLRDEVTYPLPADVPLTGLGKRRPWQLPAAILRLARIVDEQRPDAVLSAFAHPNLVTGCALALARHAPGWLARVSSPPSATDPAALRPLMRALYRRCDRVVANSETLQDVFAGTYSVRGGASYLPNATDFAQLDALAGEAVPAKPDAHLRVLAVGRLVPQKRYDLLLAAVARLVDRFAIELVICGEGAQRARLEAAGRRLPAGARLLLPGFVANPFSWMASADVFALSSDVEGLPNALVESQGLGVPAVATNCPTGPAEAIADGESGLLVPTGDADAFAQALAELLGDAERRASMGHTARARARSRYDAAAVTLELETLIEALSSR